MKKLIFPLLILCLLSVKILHPQEYTPMLNDTSIWYDTDWGNGIVTQAYKIYPNDTLINGKGYKVVLELICCNLEVIKGPVCFLREDTVEKKIYLMDFDDETHEEHLLYNFNLAPNDSFQPYYYNASASGSIGWRPEGEYMVLQSINDTVLNNRPWKVFNFNDDIKWIMGIGSLSGLFWTGNLPEFFFYLSCYYRNEELIYQSEESKELGTCCIFTGIEEKSLPGWIKNIYPSPFRDVLSIDFQVDDFNTIALSVHDITGKKVYYGEHEVIPGNGTIKLQDLGHLTSGIYLLKGRAGDKNFTVKICKGFRQGH